MAGVPKIQRIDYDPPASDLQGEHVVIENVGGTVLSLDGARLSDRAGHDYDFPAGINLSPGAQVRVWTRAGTDAAGDLFMGRRTAIWNNAPGDIAFLRTAAVVELDRYMYRSVAPMTTGLGGGGAMYAPFFSPHDPNLAFTACDMGGLYRTENLAAAGGPAWHMVDAREIHVRTSIDKSETLPRAQSRSPFAFHPSDPDLVFAFGAIRGLRVSYDRGKTWATRVALGSGWVVTAIAVDSNGRLLVGTTAHGAFSHDRDGRSWSGAAWQPCQGLAGRPVIGIRALTDPATGQAASFIATDSGPAGPGSIFRLNTATSIWEDLAGGTSVPAGFPATLGPTRRINSFAAGVQGTEIVLYVCLPSNAGSPFGGGVYRHTAAAGWAHAMGTGIDTTAGANPASIAQYERVDANAAAANEVFVSVGGGHRPAVYRSLDRGASWQVAFTRQGDPAPAAAPNVARGWLDIERAGFGGPALGLAVSRPPAAAATRAMWTNKGMLYTTVDAASTWSSAYTRRTAAGTAPGEPWRSTGLEVTTVWNYAIDPHDTQHHFLCYTDIGLAESRDGGTTWVNVRLPGRTPQESPYGNAYAVVFDPSVPGRTWVAAARQHDIPADSELFGPRPGGGVLFRDPGNADPAKSGWHNSSGALPDLPIVSIVLDSASPVNARRLWASVYGDGVWESGDAGATWTKKSNASLGFPAGAGVPENRHVYRLHRHTDGAMFCAVVGKRDAAASTPDRYVRRSGLFRSTNDGTDWQNITASLDLWAMRDYAVHPGDRNVIYVCAGNRAQGVYGAVHKTIDGGATWAPVLQFSDFTQPPESDYQDTFGPFAVFFHPNVSQTVYVTSWTHGVLQTNDGAQAPGQPHVWREITNIPFLAVNRMSFHPTDETVYLATFGGGAWPTTIHDPVDVYLRDFVGDIGSAHAGPISMSPDIIVRRSITTNPDAEYGEGNAANRDNPDLSQEVQQGQDNYLYARVRNRGPRDAPNVVVSLYWSEVSTLVTPDLWRLIGRYTLTSVPSGNVLTPSGTVIWTASQVPGPGHYCFTAVLGTRRDPEPDLVALRNWDNFLAFVRQQNNVTWRNFNVIAEQGLAPGLDGAAEQLIELPFLAPGALDRAIDMELEVIPALPDGAELFIEMPDAIGPADVRTGHAIAGGRKKHKLKPRGRQRLGRKRFPKGSKSDARLTVKVPANATPGAGRQIVVRQLYGEIEVGRVTWVLKR